MRIELKLARHYCSRLVGLQLRDDRRRDGTLLAELGAGQKTRLQIIVVPGTAKKSSGPSPSGRNG